MKVYQLSKIEQDVRIALDRNQISDALVDLNDIDTLSLEEIIDSKVCEAIKRVHGDAPVYLLDGGYNFGSSIHWEEKECGWTLLPDNFMRFVIFEMSDWKRPVFYPITAEDPEYNLQTSRYKGIRGTTQKPVCVISIRPEGRVLEFYSCKSQSATVTKAIYLPYPKIDENNGVEICEKCYDAVVYTIASLVLTTLGENDKTNIFNDLAKSVLI